MTISERIFERLAQLGMSQKQFSESTGILQSTISEWKKKKTNPTSEKIMVICQVLGVTPEWLLSGIEKNGSRKSRADWYVVGKDTELGHLINAYNNMSRERRSRLIGYAEAIESHGGIYLSQGGGPRPSLTENIGQPSTAESERAIGAPTIGGSTCLLLRKKNSKEKKKMFV